MQPTIRAKGKYSTTSEARPIIMIQFGKRVLGGNPLDLFTIAFSPENEGFSRRAVV
jgi:hypothetical protein